MKNKYAILIVATSTLGIISILINSIIIGEESNQLLNVLVIFKYFTVQSNLVVLIYFSLLLFTNLKNNKGFNKLFGGVVIYITITFLVFLLFLEPIYSPKGFALSGSILNHYITPLLVLGFLYKFKEDYTFNFSNTKIWIIYPIIYLMYLFIHGVKTHDYIYPFFEVSEVGVVRIMASVLGMIMLFVLMSFSLVKIVSKK